jgi:hypothetical protein
MEEQARAPAAPPPSVCPEPVWEMCSPVSETDIQAMQASAAAGVDELLKRGSDGGTNNSLECVAFIILCRRGATDSTGSWTPPRLLAGAGSSTDGPDPTAERLAVPLSSYVLQVLLFFSESGRIKSSVKRSVGKIFQGQVAIPTAAAKRFVGSLRSSSHVEALATMQGAYAVKALWAPGLKYEDLGQYLVARCRVKALAGADSVIMGLDTLGPRRKRPAEAVAEERPARIAFRQDRQDHRVEREAEAGAVPPPTVSSHPGLSSMAALLCWEGDLTQELASERSLQLMTELHSIVVENATLKVQLQYYKDKEELESEVRQTVSTSLSTSQPQASLLPCAARVPRRIAECFSKGQQCE